MSWAHPEPVDRDPSAYFLIQEGVDMPAYRVRGPDLEHFEGWNLIAQPPLQDLAQQAPRKRAIFCTLHAGWVVVDFDVSTCFECQPKH